MGPVHEKYERRLTNSIPSHRIKSWSKIVIKYCWKPVLQRPCECWYRRWNNRGSEANLPTLVRWNEVLFFPGTPTNWHGNFNWQGRLSGPRKPSSSSITSLYQKLRVVALAGRKPLVWFLLSSWMSNHTTKSWTCVPLLDLKLLSWLKCFMPKMVKQENYQVEFAANSFLF